VPLVPVRVNVDVPAGVEAAVVTLSVEDVPVPGTVAGLKVPPAAAGSPLKPSATAPVKPPVRVTVTAFTQGRRQDGRRPCVSGDYLW
jgi:hypothetical protein